MAFFRSRRRRKRKNRLVIDGLHLHDIRPVKAVQGDHALNRAGRLVLGAASQSGPVKVWEAANPEHAAFLRRVCQLPELSGYLPRVLAVAERFIATEWVQGEPLRDIDNNGASHCIEDMATMLAAFHNADITPLGEAGFDYWEQLIQPRFVRAAALAGHRNLGQEVCEIVNEYLLSAPRCLSHPDLTQSNIIRTQTGDLVAIDNELVAVSGAPFIDLLNATRLLSAESASAYYHAYRKNSSLVKWPPREVKRSFWLAREAGRVFAGGAITRLVQLLENYGNGKDVPPLDRAADH